MSGADVGGGLHVGVPTADVSGVKPRLLDLFCGAGGAAMGYHRAGFEVVGVDIAPQPNYPFEFVQANALRVLNGWLVAEEEREWASSITRTQPFYLPAGPLDEFDAIHASPPCQAYSSLNFYNRKSYPDLVGDVREAVHETGLPYVIENVPQAPLINPMVLCGLTFGLRVYRHRHFEASFPLMMFPHMAHDAPCVRNGYLPDDDEFMSIHGGRHSKEWQRKAARVMGVPWMQTIPEVCEAIPPAYTEHIGGYLLTHLEAQKAIAA